MPSIDVTILRDPSDPPPFADITDLVVATSPNWRAAILEAGMTSGKPSVALAIPTTAGTVIAETSLESLIALLAAARGAFPEVFAGGPFDDLTDRGR